MLLETEQATARWLAAMGDEELMGTVVRELRLMFPGAPSPVSSLIPPNPEPKPKPKPKPDPNPNSNPNPNQGCRATAHRLQRPQHPQP